MTALCQRGRPSGSRIAASALLAALSLSACGTPAASVWSKEGVTQEALKRDQKDCVAEANGYGFLASSPAQTGGTIVASQQQGDIYRACMARKGYRHYAPGDAPESKPQASD